MGNVQHIWNITTCPMSEWLPHSKNEHLCKFIMFEVIISHREGDLMRFQILLYLAQRIFWQGTEPYIEHQTHVHRDLHIERHSSRRRLPP